MGLDEEEFYVIAMGHQVSPWQFDSSAIRQGDATPDFSHWLRGDGLDSADAEDRLVAGLKLAQLWFIRWVRVSESSQGFGDRWGWATSDPLWRLSVVVTA